jgi:hypothetical protein
VHVAASPEVIDEVLAAENRAGFLYTDELGVVRQFPNPSAEEPREDVGFALTDAEAAEAERAVSEAFDHNIKAPMGDADWGGEIRRKLGIARGKLDGLAQDLEESGGWEETVKEIRQTLRETADPNPRPVDELLVPGSLYFKRLQENLDAAYEAAGISGLENLAQHIKSMRAERDALREKLAFRVHEPGTFAALQAEVEAFRRAKESGT